MEHDEMDDRWVDERLSSLEPPDDWRPNAAAAFARFGRRAAPPRRQWWLWASVSATAAAACAILMLVSIPTACANPLGCRQSGAVVDSVNFKEAGSRSASVTCELYNDYECPHCASFSLQTMPRFTDRYVATGKVHLIQRDFPLPRHRYAKLAAQYANAAGEAGYYQAVANKLYQTQEVWSSDGNVDAQVGRVVPTAQMAKVRERAREVSLDADEARAREQHVDRTPALLCNGRMIGPDLSFGQIEAQLDSMVTQR